MTYSLTNQDLELAFLIHLQLDWSPSESLREMVEIREAELGCPIEVSIDHHVIGRFWDIKSRYGALKNIF